jgi:hypothetical protein
VKQVTGLFSVALLLGGCASAPSISELNQGVNKVVLVKNGTAPLNFSTGVVDTSSFWAAYGSGVSSNLGGGQLWKDLESSGQRTQAAKVDQNAEMVRKLYGAHELASKVNGSLLPQLASAWGVSYDERSVIALTDKPAFVDSKTGLLQGVSTDADLVLMSSVTNVNLTELFSMGGAFKAGFTMGANKKRLTTEVHVALHAFKRDTAAGGYKQVWFQPCGPDYVTMKTGYFLDELAQTPQKMTEILDEASVQAVALCTKALNTVASSGTVVDNR